MSPGPIIQDISTLGTAFNPESLSPDEHKRGTQLAHAATALILKGMFHRLRPNEYRVSDNQEAIENRIAASVGDIDSHLFERMRPKVESIYNSPARLAELLDDLSEVDLRSPGLDSRIHQAFPDLVAHPGGIHVPPIPHIPVIAPPEPPQPPGPGGIHVPPIPDVFPHPPQDQEPQDQEPQPHPEFTRLTFILRNLHCLDETNPEGGEDEMIIAGIRVGASGYPDPFPGFVAGEDFEAGVWHDFGALPLGGQYSLNTTAGYPKRFFCIFTLVESDQDDEDAANAVTSGLSLIAKSLAPMIGSVAAVADAVIQMADGIIGLFTDDNRFPPYGVELKLSSPNDFGDTGNSKNEHTGNISAHGGTYQIGYRWELSA